MWSNAGESGGGRESNGVDDDHNGFVDDVRGWDFTDDGNDPSDGFGHGTHVAGTIGAQGGNGIGVAGVNWDTSIMPVKVLTDQGWGTQADVAAGFVYAAANGAKVVNASLGGGGDSQVMTDAVRGAPDTLFVVSAGNSHSDNDTGSMAPCTIPSDNLICVAATDKHDALAGFSSYGAQSVDLAAPGVDIVSTAVGDTVSADRAAPRWDLVLRRLRDGTRRSVGHRWGPQHVGAHVLPGVRPGGAQRPVVDANW